MSLGQNAACVVGISCPVRQGVLHGDRSLENTRLVRIHSSIAIEHVPWFSFVLHGSIARSPSRLQRCCIFIMYNLGIRGGICFPGCFSMLHCAPRYTSGQHWNDMARCRVINIIFQSCRKPVHFFGVPCSSTYISSIPTMMNHFWGGFQPPTRDQCLDLVQVITARPESSCYY